MEALHEEIHMAPMPFTCKDATNVDSAVIHPTLAQFVVRIQVLQSQLFDAHSPILVDFHMPASPVHTFR